MLKNIIILIISTFLISGTCFAQSSKSRASTNNIIYKDQVSKITKLLESSKDNNTISKKEISNSLAKHYDSLVNEELISHTQKNEALENFKKTTVSSNSDLTYLANKITEWTFVKGNKCLKQSQACSTGLDNCCGGSVCSNTSQLVAGELKIRTQCIKQLKLGQRCDPSTGGCLDSQCTLISNHTDASLCSIAGQSCSSDSQCCSGSCDNKVKRCLPNYKCENCVQLGGSINNDKGKINKRNVPVCCDGLFPNSNGICEPIYPVENKTELNNFLFKLFSYVDFFIQKAQASESTLIAQIEDMLSSIKQYSINDTLSKLPIDNLNISKVIDVFNAKLTSCKTMTGSVSCLSSLKNRIDFVEGKARIHSKNIEDFEKSLEKLKEEISKIPDGPGLSGFKSKFDVFNKTKKICIGHYKDWSSYSDSSDKVDAADKCIKDLDAIRTDLTQAIGDITASNTYLLSQFDENGNAMNSEFYSQGINVVDHSLYDGYDEATPILGNISVSEMSSCRVNLFGDYLAKQSDDYFKVMMTLLGMDYVTSGQGVEDYFDVGSWALQTFGVEDDIKNFNISVGGNNSTAQKFLNYGDQVKQEIKKYYDTLSDDEKLIWTHLFYNSFVKPKHKKAILDYFIVMANGYDESIKGEITLAKDQLKSTLTTKSLPDPSSYNLYRITRFESVKFKMYLYKMYGILKRKSVEMTCRCVDTIGPMNGDEWLKPDVEKQYLTFCGGLGKYNLFVMANDNKCEKKDSSGECIDVEHAAYWKEVLQKEEEKYVQDNILCDKDADGNCLDSKVDGFKTNDASDVKERLANNYTFTKLSELKISSSRVSKFNKFVKNGKVTFAAERGKNKVKDFVVGDNFDELDYIVDNSTNSNRADGDGLKFSAFLRDMSLMKVDALTKVATNNIFSITSSLALTSQFVSTFNWGYRESNAEITTVTRKYLLPQLWLAKLVQLIFGGGESGGFSYTYFKDDINVTYSGNNSLIQQRVSESVNSLSPRPYKICEKEKSKRKSWKVAGVKIGEKWTWRCVNYKKIPNKICNSTLPVGMCMKTVYAYENAGSVDFILDPFIPDGTGLIKDDKFNPRLKSNAIVRELGLDLQNKIKSRAKDYMKSQVFDFGAWSATGQDKQSFSDEEIDAFSQLVFDYHFVKPKKSYYLRYGTPGLVPYYRQLTDNAHNLSLSILDDLIMTSSYALKMHNFYYNVRKGIRTGLIMDQNQLGEFQIDPITYNPVGVADFLTEIGSTAPSKNNFSFNSGANRLIEDGSNSTNPDVAGFAGSLKAMSDYDRDKNDRAKRLDEYLKSKGRKGELDKMKNKIANQNANANKLGDRFANSLKSIAGQRLDNSRFNFSKGKQGLVSSYRPRSRFGISSQAGEALNSSSSNTDSSMSVKGDGGASSLRKGSRSSSNSKDGEGSSVEDFSDFSLGDLEDESINDFILGDSGETFNKKALKSYIKKAGNEALSVNNEVSKNPDWEREGVTLFRKISTRYKKSAFPKFLKSVK